MIVQSDELPHQQAHIPIAALWLIVSLLLYTLQDVFIKKVDNAIPALEIIFFRSLFSLVPIALILLYQNQSFHTVRKTFQTRYLKVHIIRAVMLFLSLTLYVYACRTVDLPSLYTLSYCTPLFMSLVAACLLGERLNRVRLLSIALGFIGVVIVIQPGGQMFSPYALLAVVSAFLTATATVLGRKLSVTDSTSLLVVMYSGVCFLGSAFFLPLIWVEPVGVQWRQLTLIGILGGFAQFGFTQAFKLAPVSRIAPLDYSSLLWAILFDYLLWSQMPSSSTLTGAGCVIVSGLMIFYYDRSSKPIKFT